MANEHDQGTPPPPPDAVTAKPPDEQRIALPAGPEGATDAARSVPMTPDEPPAWLGVADWLIAGLVLALSFLLGSFVATNSDAWLHLATGRLLARGDYAFGDDPFSFAGSRPWVNHSWLFDGLLYGVYQLVGGPGLVVLKALGVALLALVLLRVRFRGTSRWVSAMCVLLAVLALSPRLLLQPAVVSFLLLGVTLLLLHRAGAFAGAAEAEAETERFAPKLLWALPPLFVLWVNLDNWFILGPLTVGLCWLGLGVQRFLRLPYAVPARQLGIVFGVGLLACVLNPFHVRAFVLPPELAYVVQRLLATLFGPVDLPDALFGGGETLLALQRDPSLARFTVSPFSASFFGDPYLGWNLAGFAFYLLLALGLAAFVLQAVLNPKPESAGLPPLHAARFLVWLFFAGLAATQYRLIPFFAVVAGPLTALSLGEVVVWLTRPREGAVGPSPWTPTAKLARILGVVLLAALLLLAWPGWLNAPMDASSPRRVGWDVVADPSARRAAEELAALREAGQGDKVFNASLDVAHVGAWYAPGVRFFLDGRYNLFPGVADDFARAKAALVDPTQPADAWAAAFAGHGIDHVVLPNFLGPPSRDAFWAAPERWLPRYGDARAAVFSWAGPGRRWPAGRARERWNKLAFGKDVPPAYRAPADGPLPPAEEPNPLAGYLAGTPPLPRAALEADYQLAYYDFAAGRWLVPAELGLHVGSWAAAVANVGSPAAPVVPGQVLSTFWQLGSGAYKQRYADSRRTVFRGTDPGPPAHPLLAVRLARQAVAENPADERAYRRLADAYRVLQHDVEDYWANYAGQGQGYLRDQLRRLQIVNAARTALQLRPDDAQLRLHLHDLYLQRNFLDAALEQLVEAERLFAERRPNSARQAEEFKAARAELEKRRQALQDEVTRRQADYDLKAAAARGLDKYRLAVGPYRFLNADNREVVDPRGRGLAKQAVKALQEMDPKALSPDELADWRLSQLRLALELGEVRPVAEILPELKDALDPRVAVEFQALVAGVLGRYDAMQAALLEREKQVLAQVARSYLEFVSARLLAERPGLGNAYRVLVPLDFVSPSLSAWRSASAQLYDLRTLRALAALESGDTDLAHNLLQTTLRQAGGLNFPDRPIAERYAAYLARQR